MKRIRCPGSVRGLFTLGRNRHRFRWMVVVLFFLVPVVLGIAGVWALQRHLSLPLWIWCGLGMTSYAIESWAQVQIQALGPPWAPQDESNALDF